MEDAVSHLARRTGLEAVMILTNQSKQSKTIIRHDFALTEERKLRRQDAMSKNRPAYDEFIRKVTPVLDGTLASADRLHGDFAIEKLFADFEKLTLGVNPHTIQLAESNLEKAFQDIDEERAGGSITRDILHFTLDRIAPGKTFEITRSSGFESMALNFTPFSQNCDARNTILFITLLIWIHRHYDIHIYNNLRIISELSTI